jgi:hypothetical protein
LEETQAEELVMAHSRIQDADKCSNFFDALEGLVPFVKLEVRTSDG